MSEFNQFPKSHVIQFCTMQIILIIINSLDFGG
jgi:hypothetical protein